MNFYQANALGLGGIFTRPLKDTLQSQAAACLPSSGGHTFSSVENFSFHGLVSFRRAYVEVGGSFDECHNTYTSYSHSVIEGLNIADMVTADRVVCRVAAYSPQVESVEDGEYSFSITGSFFEKLRIAGHLIDVKLATHLFHEHDTYSKIAKASQAGKIDDWQPGSKLGGLDDSELAKLEDTYHTLGGISKRIREWKQSRSRQPHQDTYLFSPANHLKLEDYGGSKADLCGFGAIILVPRFGVVRLADLLIQRSNRQLIMLRVEMGSPIEGTITGSSSQVGGYLLSEGRSQKGRSASHHNHPVEASTEQRKAAPKRGAKGGPVTLPVGFHDVGASEVQHFPERSVDVELQRFDTEPRLQSLPKSATLKQGARYQIRMHIGRRAMDSIVSGKMPTVDPLLPDPEDARGHELEFVVQPKDFQLLSRQLQRFNLPLAGESDPVYFTIRAPRKAVSTAELRILLYYRNHIVQSFLLSAKITNDESTGSESQESLRVSLEFTRTERFMNLDSLEPRLLSIAINRGPAATHNISVKGTNGVDGNLRLDPGTFDDQVKDLRTYLRIATEDPENPGTARLYPEIADGDPAPEPLATAIRELAKKGKKLYDALFAGAAAQQPKLRADLVDIREKSDERLQVVRYGFDYVFPWTLLYDYDLPEDTALGSVCLGRMRNSQGKPQPCKCTVDSGAFCVSGFWGIRHQVEEFLGGGRATDTHVSLPLHGAIRIVADAELLQAQELEKFLKKEVGTSAVSTGPTDGKQLIELLWKVPPVRPAVLIVLGHMEETDERIRLVRDKNWLSRAKLDERSQKEKEAWDQPRSIILLMACDSAATSLKTVNNFVIAFNTAGAAAVVGTECIVDSQLAAQFAQQVSIAMLKGHLRLGAAITEFRRASLQRGNPLAFVFNAIGDVDLRIQ